VGISRATFGNPSEIRQKSAKADFCPIAAEIRNQFGNPLNGQADCNRKSGISYGGLLGAFRNPITA
jgi:hypothetical protein